MREALEALVKLLAPFAPFFSQELWSMMGRETMLLRESWPGYDPELAREEEYEIVVQVNGRLRSRMVVTAGTPQDEVQRRALADPRVAPLMAGKQLVRAIVVPNKLVNLVIRG
jgi:leucyl-tRNA synthetase